MKKVHAIRIHAQGGPEVLRWEAVDVGPPGPGQVRLRQIAVGLNYIDIYLRNGIYPVQDFPAVIGAEAAGVVDQVGEGVAHLKPGDRVAYAMVTGAYAEQRLIAAERLVRLPDDIDDRTAAAMMLKGLTAHYLLHRTYAVKRGDAILVTAAAGGVGLLLCQWGKHLGATVIGCVGSEDKAQLAKANGCDHVIYYRHEDIAQRVRELTGGEGVAVSYDSVGQTTFEASLNALRPFGMLVTFGNTTGHVEPFSPKILAAKGSLYVTRPTLVTHTATRELLEEGAARLFDAVRQGIIRINVNRTYPLAQAAQAQRDLEARKTTGSTVLLV